MRISISTKDNVGMTALNIPDGHLARNASTDEICYKTGSYMIFMKERGIWQVAGLEYCDNKYFDLGEANLCITR